MNPINITMSNSVNAITPDPVPYHCLYCICKVESNCDEYVECKGAVNSRSCGPYQIKEDYYSDALSINPVLGTGKYRSEPDPSHHFLQNRVPSEINSGTLSLTLLTDRFVKALFLNQCKLTLIVLTVLFFLISRQYQQLSLQRP